MSAVAAPLRSSTVLMAMVEPCSNSPTAATSHPASRSAVAAPTVGSAGTVSVLAVTMAPSATPTRSVKVPPMSMPTMLMDWQRSSEPHRDELVVVQRLGVGHGRQGPQFLERSADHVDRLRIPGAVRGEAGNLGVVDLLDDALAHIERALLRFHRELPVRPHEGDGLEPGAQKAPQHVRALLDHVV